MPSIRVGARRTAIDVTRDKYGREIVHERGEIVAADPCSQLEIHQYEDLPWTGEFLGGRSPRQVAQMRNGLNRQIIHEIDRNDSDSQTDFLQYPELTAVPEHRREYDARNGNDQVDMSSRLQNWTTGPHLSVNEKQRAVAGSSENDIQISQYQDVSLEKLCVKSFLGPILQHSDYCFEKQVRKYCIHDAYDIKIMVHFS